MSLARILMPIALHGRVDLLMMILPMEDTASAMMGA